MITATQLKRALLAKHGAAAEIARQLVRTRGTEFATAKSTVSQWAHGQAESAPIEELVRKYFARLQGDSKTTRTRRKKS